ncbi:hypothetical protein JKF63_02075 [Porcisia hertigi]|uniref:Uncharacterized protein n=1 Tax=Porcisia hertigi TaxID=2761500 RepID=A0A836LCC4_9TRYP|nr:hypothetical protein JKF63_02075 [Porcisia hertigi]
MFSSATSASLTSSSHLLAATWENALHHYRRALLECGSPLSIEHSQRLGLLFSRNVGDTNELKRWTSIFDAEDVPATALILKALVNHGQWQTAIKLLALNKERGVTCELSDVLAQCLVARGFWQQTIQLAEFLHQCPDNIAPKEHSTVLKNTSKLNRRCLNDSYEMLSNPAFLPEEEKTTYCGFASAVARACPSKREWREAVRILQDLEQLVDQETKKKLYEYKIARLVHDGEAYKYVIESSQRELAFRTSPSLLRSLLHCAIATSDCGLIINCLELLCSCASTAISVRLFETACRLVLLSDRTWMKEDLLRFEFVICEKAALVKDRKLQKLISAFCVDYDLKMPIFALPVAMLSSTSKAARTASIANSITNLDRLASTLISQNRWEEALQVATLISTGAAQSDNERIIVDVLRRGSLSWEKTLQFFTS